MQQQLTTMDLIEDFRGDFPHLKDKVYFITGEDRPDAPGTRRSISGDVWGKIWSSQMTIREINELNAWCNMIEKSTNDLPSARRSPWGIAVISGFDTEGLNEASQKMVARAMRSGGILGGMLDAQADKEFGALRLSYDLANVFDHEIGHVLTRPILPRDKVASSYQKETTKRNLYVEAAADAYAAIRHIERFGADTGYVEYLRDVRTREAIYEGKTGHFTADALDRVIEMRDRGVFRQSRTPDDRVKLAIEAAGAGLVIQAVGNEINSAFLKVREIPEKNVCDPVDMVRLIKDISITSRSLAVVSAAELHLRAVRMLPDFSPALKRKISAAHEISVLSKRMAAYPVSAKHALKNPAF